MDKNIITQLASKRLETTMIGALSKFENVFGYLWGQHKSHDEPLTDKEMHFDNMWQDVRNNILNHGNQQIRALQNDINKALSDRPQTKYNYKFRVDPQD
jgi:hypothetical protein